MKIERKALFTFNTLSEREAKNIEILGLIRKKGPISRSDISRITGINMVSISNYIREYIDKGLVVEKGFDVSSGGRKPELIELNSEKKFTIGIDISSSRIRICITDIAMRIKKKAEAPVQSPGIDNLVAATTGLVGQVLKETGLPPGDLPIAGIAVSDEKLFSVTDAIGKELGLKVFAGTDTFAAAFAQSWTNPDAEDKALLYVHSDVGSGTVIKKDIFISGADMEGVRHDPDESAYLRPWGAALAISQIAKQEVTRGVGTKIVDIAHGSVDNITMDAVIEASGQNDQLALDIIHSAGINLGLRTAYLINIFRPDIVIIGGGIERSGELLLEPLRNMVEKLAFNRFKNIPIMPSTIGAYAVSMGASLLGTREFFLKA